jgi:uncharacterized protein (DUF1778 family)
MGTRASRTEDLDLNVSPEVKQAITEAANAAGQSVSEFVLSSALAKAEGTLPNRPHPGLTTEQWAAFQAALDAAPADQERLRRLLHDPGVVDPDDAE